MNELLLVLKISPLFRDIPDEVLRRTVLPHGRLQAFSKGQHVIAPQQQVNQVGILVTGRIHIAHIFSDGTYSLINVLVRAGAVGADLIGTRSQLSPYHAISAAASQVFFLPSALFLRPGQLEERLRLQVLDRLLQVISDENIKKEYRLAILSQKGLRERIMTYLTMQAAKRRTNTFTIPFSREELASYLCVNRSALSHTLSLLQQEGMITFHKNNFILNKL